MSKAYSGFRRIERSIIVLLLVLGTNIEGYAGPEEGSELYPAEEAKALEEANANNPSSAEQEQILKKIKDDPQAVLKFMNENAQKADLEESNSEKQLSPDQKLMLEKIKRDPNGALELMKENMRKTEELLNQ